MSITHLEVELSSAILLVQHLVSFTHLWKPCGTFAMLRTYLYTCNKALENAINEGVEILEMIDATG